MTTFTVDYGPSTNRMWRYYRGRPVLSSEAKAYKLKVFADAANAGVEPITGDVKLTLHVYRPRKVGDIDNRVKVVCDAIQGIAYADDKQISELHVYRHDDKKNPRIEITLEAA